MYGYKEIKIVLMDSAHERLEEKAWSEGKSSKQVIMELIGMYLEEENQVGLTDKDILMYFDILTEKEANELLCRIDTRQHELFGPTDEDPI